MKRTRRITPVGTEDNIIKETSSPDGKQRKLDDDSLLGENTTIEETVEEHTTELVGVVGGEEEVGVDGGEVGVDVGEVGVDVPVMTELAVEEQEEEQTIMVDTTEHVIEAPLCDETVVVHQQVHQDINAIDELPAELSETPMEVNITTTEVAIDGSQGQIVVDDAHYQQDIVDGSNIQVYGAPVQEQMIIQQPQQQVVQQQQVVHQQQQQVVHQQMVVTPCSIQQQIDQQIQVEQQNQLHGVSNGLQSAVANIDLVAIAANAEHIPVTQHQVPLQQHQQQQHHHQQQQQHIPQHHQVQQQVQQQQVAVTPPIITPMKRGRGRPRKNATGISPQIIRHTPAKPVAMPTMGHDNATHIRSPLVSDGASARRARQQKAKKVFEDYEENYVPGKRGKDESSDDDDYDVPPAPKPRNLVRDMQEAGIESLSVQLPVPELMQSLNTSQQPEIRTLYIFQNTPKNGWLKIICKRLDGIQYYQCPMCPYVDPVPREVADHLNKEHHHMMNIAEGKCTRIFSTFLFMFCRHCDFIAYEKLALWYHYEHYHNLKDMIGSKSVNPDSINMNAFPNLPQSSLLNAKMILRCTECPFLCLSKRHALLHAQKMHFGSHKSHGNGFVAMSQLNERNKPTPIEAITTVSTDALGQQVITKPNTTTVNIQANSSLVEATVTSDGVVQQTLTIDTAGGQGGNETTLPMRSMTLKDIFICSECLFITYKRPLMEVHCVNNHARRVLLLVCSMCEAQFDTIYKMSAHIGETHDEIKRQFCSVTVIDQEGKEDINLKTTDTRRMQSAIDQTPPGAQSLLKPGQLNNSQLAVTMQSPGLPALKGPTTAVVATNAGTMGVKSIGDKSMMPMDSQKFRYVKLPDGRVLQIPAENPGSSQPRYIKLPDGTILKLPMPNDKAPLDIIKKAEIKANPSPQMKKHGQNVPTTRYLKMPDGTLHQLPIDGKLNSKSIQMAQKTAVAAAASKTPMRYLKMPDGTLRAITSNVPHMNKGGLPHSIQSIRKNIPSHLKKEVRYLKLPDGSLHEIPPLADGMKSETRYLKLPDGTLHKIPAEFNMPKNQAPNQQPSMPKPSKFLKMPDGSIKPLNDDGTPALVPPNTRYVQMPDGTIHQINCPPETTLPETNIQEDKIEAGQNGETNTRYLQMPDGSIQQITSDHPIDKDTRYVQMPDGSIQAIAPGQTLPGEEAQPQIQHQQQQQIADTTTCTASSDDLALQEQSLNNQEQRYLQLPDGSIHPLPEGMDANDPNLKFVQMPDGTIQQVPVDQSDDPMDSNQQQEQIMDQTNEQLMLETQQMINASQSAIPSQNALQQDDTIQHDQTTQDLQNNLEQTEPHSDGQPGDESADAQANSLSDEHRQQLISQGIDPNIVQSYIQLPDGTLQPINPGEEEQYQQMAAEQQQQLMDQQQQQLLDEQQLEGGQPDQQQTDEQLLEGQQQQQAEEGDIQDPLQQQQQQQDMQDPQQQQQMLEEQVEGQQQMLDETTEAMPDQDPQQQQQMMVDEQNMDVELQQVKQEIVEDQQYTTEDGLQEQQEQQVDATQQETMADEETEYINLESGPDPESRYLRLSDGTLLQIPNMPETDQVQFVRLPDNRVLQLPPTGSNEPAIVIKDPVIEQCDQQPADQEYMPDQQQQQEGEEQQYMQEGDEYAVPDQEMPEQVEGQQTVNEQTGEVLQTENSIDQQIESQEEQLLEGQEGQLVEQQEEQLLEGQEEQLLEGQEEQLVEGQEGQLVEGQEDQLVEGQEEQLLEGQEGQLVEGQEEQLVEGQEGQLLEGQEGQLLEGQEGQLVEGQEEQLVEGQEGQFIEGQGGEFVEGQETQLDEGQESQLVEGESELVERQEDQLMQDEYVEAEPQMEGGDQPQEHSIELPTEEETVEPKEAETSEENITIEVSVDVGEDTDSAITAGTPEVDSLPIMEEAGG